MLASNIDCVPAASGTEMGASAAVTVSFTASASGVAIEGFDVGIVWLFPRPVAKPRHLRGRQTTFCRAVRREDDLGGLSRG